MGVAIMPAVTVSLVDIDTQRCYGTQRARLMQPDPAADK